MKKLLFALCAIVALVIAVPHALASHSTRYSNASDYSSRSENSYSNSRNTDSVNRNIASINARIREHQREIARLEAEVERLRNSVDDDNGFEYNDDDNYDDSDFVNDYNDNYEDNYDDDYDDNYDDYDDDNYTDNYDDNDYSDADSNEETRDIVSIRALVDQERNSTNVRIAFNDDTVRFFTYHSHDEREIIDELVDDLGINQGNIANLIDFKYLD
jgi:hypothetical protein